jgi:DNA-directed RNA polymerase subunit RPC12/RpoP
MPNVARLPDVPGMPPGRRIETPVELARYRARLKFVRPLEGQPGRWAAWAFDADPQERDWSTWRVRYECARCGEHRSAAGLLGDECPGCGGPVACRPRLARVMKVAFGLVWEFAPGEAYVREV